MHVPRLRRQLSRLREGRVTVAHEPPGIAKRSRTRLRAEFLGLFVALPVGVAVFLPPAAMFPLLVAATALGMALLHFTDGFQWRDLLQGRRRIDWRIVAIFAVLTAFVSAAILTVLRPHSFFILYRTSPWVWLAVMVLYPVLSALPQEIVFRPLFFRRYGPILPRDRGALVTSAAVYSLAHLLYWNWIVVVMTFAGGLAFAWAYEVRRSFPMAVILHAVAGNILFTVGTGMFFFAGTVQRPF